MICKKEEVPDNSVRASPFVECPELVQVMAFYCAVQLVISVSKTLRRIYL